MNLKKIIHFSIGPLATAALGFITIPLLAWITTVDNVGRFSLLQTVIAFALLILTLGLDQAYVREYHEASNKKQIIKAVNFASISVALAAGIIFFAPLSSLVVSTFHVQSPFFYILVFITVLVCIVVRLVSTEFRLTEKGLLYSAVQVVPKAAFLVLISSAYYVAQSEKVDFLKLVIINLIAQSIALAICLYFIDLRVFIHERVDYLLLKKMTLFGLPLIISGFLYLLMISIPRLFLVKFSDFKELGIYSVVVSVAAGIGIFTSIFNTIWSPMIYKWVTESGGIDKIKKVNNFILIASCFILLFTVFFSWMFASLFPPVYADITYLLPCALIQPVLYALSESTAVGVNIVRKTGLSILTSLFGVMAAGAIGYILIPDMGASGAIICMAWASWLSYMIRSIVSDKIWLKLSSTIHFLVALAMVVISTAIIVVRPSIITLMMLSLSFSAVAVYVCKKDLSNLLQYAIKKSFF